MVRAPRWFERVLASGVLPTDDEALAARKRIISGAALLSPSMLIAIGVIYLVYGEDVAGATYCAMGGWIWLNLIIFARVHRSLTAAFWATAPIALVAHLVVIVSLGDIIHSGGLLLWGLAYPVATGLVFVPVRQMIPLYVMYAVNIVVTSLLHSHRAHVPPGIERGILMANLLALSAFAVAILDMFVAQRDRAYLLLGEEQRRGRALLLSILPEEIADELTRGPRVIADQFQNVSVMFADVVGFTPLSAAMTPAELVLLLDDLFGRFDALVDAAGLEKIKTIGDCYMVASGIPRPRADHAQALVRLALQMLEATHDYDFQGRRLQLRIGINSGAVVAGVIGRRKFSYDLWGDVVNTASRMESHGVAGAVQVAEPTHGLVKGAFTCTPRGVIEVRGKGAMPVWIVTANDVQTARTAETALNI